MKTILYIILFFCVTRSSSAQLQPITSGVFHWADCPTKIEEDREIKSVLDGSCSGFKLLTVHLITEKNGAKPLPVKTSKDVEKIIIMREGKARVSVGTQSAILGAGGVVLVLPREMHRLENIGQGPLSYYVIQYQSEKSVNMERGKSGGGSLLLNKDSLQFNLSANGGRRNYFDRTTAMCEKLELHVTQLIQKGPGHAPHTHVDNEIILVIAGDTEININSKAYAGTLGDLYFINSEVLHGVGNSANDPCMYFALRWR